MIKKSVTTSRDANAISPWVQEMLAGADAFCDAMEAGARIEDHFKVSTVRMEIKIQELAAADVVKTRQQLGASQETLAMFLGVSVDIVQAWEDGTEPVPPMACRYLDDLVTYPAVWRGRLDASTTRTASTSPHKRAKKAGAPKKD
jgi:putative transcriptional regulator